MTARQLTLLAEPRSRAKDPATSKAAAATQTGGVEAEIMFVFTLSSGPGWTDDEVCRALPLFYAPTVKSARSRLSNRGLLVDSGERRKSDRGRDQIVWRLAP